MRLVVVLAVLISVAAQAHAEDSRAPGPRESRYGPTTPRQAAVAVAAATVRYDGPMLGWAGKRQASPVLPEPQASAPTRPTPIAGWAGYQATPVPSAYAPPPPSAAPAPPTSLYAAPRAAQPTTPQPVTPRPSPVTYAPATPTPTVDWSNYRSARVTAAASTPAQAPVNFQAQPTARQPVATPPPPPQPRQVAAVNTNAAGARFYSVGREYGLTPDVIPPAGPDTRVLITASEPPPEAKDAVPQHGSADWLAAGVNGDGDDDSSAARRAKTRDQAL
jgi:hypothetical protein